MARRKLSTLKKSSANKPTFRINDQQALTFDRHNKMLDTVMQIITPGISAHQNKVAHYFELLIALAAMPIGEGVDQARAEAYAKGESSVVGDTRYPKALGHLNSISISVMQILFPANQMYGSVELDVTKQGQTAGVVQAMNVHSKQYKHYTAIARVVMDSLALNIGIMTNKWDRQKAVFGSARKSQSNVTRDTSSKSVREGQKLRHCDPLNTILQPGIDPEDYQFEAQYYAYVEQVNSFDLLRLAEKGEVVFNEDMTKNLREITYNQSSYSTGAEVANANTTNFYEGLAEKFGHGAFTGKLGLYKNRPNMHRPIYTNVEKSTGGLEAKCFDYTDFRTKDGNQVNFEEMRPDCCNELLTVVVRSTGKALGLKKSAKDDDGMRLWEFKILNGAQIIQMREISTAHGMMNIAITRPLTDLGRGSSLAMSEKLLPFQEASGSLLNSFIRKARGSANNGMTYTFDKLMDKAQVSDPATGNVQLDFDSARQLGIKDIRGAVSHVGGEAPDRSLLQGIDALGTRMQDVVPTDAIEQMSNLNRPVAHQSRTLTRLQNMHVYALARIIHEELMMPTTHMHTQDTLSFQQQITVVGPDGKSTQIDPSLFADLELDVAASDGMRGLDTMAIADRIERVLQYAFQSRRVQNDIDVVKLTNYLLQMDGSNVDLNMFRYENEWDKLSDDERTLAYQLYLQASQENIEGEASQ